MENETQTQEPLSQVAQPVAPPVAQPEIPVLSLEILSQEVERWRKLAVTNSDQIKSLEDHATSTNSSLDALRDRVARFEDVQKLVQDGIARNAASMAALGIFVTGEFERLANPIEEPALAAPETTTQNIEQQKPAQDLEQQTPAKVTGQRMNWG